MTGPFVPIEGVSKHFSVSVSTIRAWVRKGIIPKATYIKVGNTYRFSIDDVATALTRAVGREDHLVAAKKELERQAADATPTVSGVDASTNLDEDL